MDNGIEKIEASENYQYLVVNPREEMKDGQQNLSATKLIERVINEKVSEGWEFVQYEYGVSLIIFRKNK